MIGTINVKCNAAHPEMALPGVFAFADSPSSVRVIDVPKKIGKWSITKVYLTAVYPNSSSTTAECVLTGGCWVGTLAGSGRAGTSKNGFTIAADGMDENGNAVTGYVLGKGDLTVLGAGVQPNPDQTSWYVRVMDSESEYHNTGDLWPADGTYYVWQNEQANAIGPTRSEMSAKADLSAVQSALGTKADLSALNEVENEVTDLGNRFQGYYAKTETSSSVELDSEFADVRGAIAGVDNSLSGYYAKTETSSAAEIQGALDGKQPTGDYALTSQIPTNVSQLANDAGYLTEHQSLSGYYEKSETSSATELNTAFETAREAIDDVENSLSDYYTKAETSSSNEISTALGGKLDLSATAGKALISQKLVNDLSDEHSTKVVVDEYDNVLVQKYVQSGWYAVAVDQNGNELTNIYVTTPQMFIGSAQLCAFGTIGSLNSEDASNARIGMYWQATTSDVTATEFTSPEVGLNTYVKVCYSSTPRWITIGKLVSDSFSSKCLAMSKLTNDKGYLLSSQVKPDPTYSNSYHQAWQSRFAWYLKAPDIITGTDRQYALRINNAHAELQREYYASWFMSKYYENTFDPPIELKWTYIDRLIYRQGSRTKYYNIYDFAWASEAGAYPRYIIKTTPPSDDGGRYYPSNTFVIHNSNTTAPVEKTITFNNNVFMTSIATIDGEENQISCDRASYGQVFDYLPLAFADDLSAGLSVKADLSTLNAVESSLSDYALTSQIPLSVSQLENDSGYLTEHQSLSNYYTKSETSSNVEISTALDLKQDKLTDEQMANVNMKCLPLNLSGNTAISGNNYLDFHCLPRFFAPVVMNGALDVQQLNIVNYDVDSYTALSAMDEDTLGFVGGFNREHIAILNLKNDTIAYISDVDAMISSKADLSALNEVENSLSNYYTKSETSSNTEISVALNLKQDKLSNAQISSINSVVDERTTYFTFPNNEIQSVYVEGMLDTNYLQQLNPELSHEKILTATEVKIGTAVTGIAQSAFNGCSNLVKVTIPDSVVTIGEMAFGACYALVRLEIPDGVNTINNLFNYTDVHADIVFGKGVQSISQGMFHYVSPASVTFKGKTLAEVQAMTDYPWDIEDTSIIKTYNIATQEWVLEQLSALEARIAALENN